MFEGLLNKIITPTLLITILGIVSYYFGEIIISQKPWLIRSKFNSYFNGILFLTLFIISPLLIDLLIIKYAFFNSINEWVSLVLFGFSFLYIYINARKLTFKLMGKNTKLKQPKQIKLFIFSLFIQLPIIFYYTYSYSLQFLLFLGISFILWTMMALLFANTPLLFIGVEFIDIDNKKIKGKWIETGDDFLKIAVENFIYILPLKRMKTIKFFDLKKDLAIKEAKNKY